MPDGPRESSLPTPSGLTLPSLYAILDFEATASRGWSPADVCRAWLAAGIRLVQLRAKALESGPMAELAGAIGALCDAAGADLIINDRADIAALSGAAGVHLGQDDLAPAQARRVVGQAAIVGLSTHTWDQVSVGLREPVSYLAIGPVFATSTKATGYQPLGLDGVRRAKALAMEQGRPLVAIGGMTLELAGAVRDAGADSLAVISGLLPDRASDLESRARAWLRASRARL